MGNLVADAMLDRVKGQGVTIALQNGGGLRASIGAGEVTHGRRAGGAAVPEHALDLQHHRGRHRRGARERRQPGRGGRRPLPAGRGAALQLGSEGRAERRGGSSGRGAARARPGCRSTRPRSTPSPPTTSCATAATAMSRCATQGTNAYDFGPGLEEVLADYLADASRLSDRAAGPDHPRGVSDRPGWSAAVQVAELVGPADGRGPARSVDRVEPSRFGLARRDEARDGSTGGAASGRRSSACTSDAERRSRRRRLDDGRGRLMPPSAVGRQTVAADAVRPLRRATRRISKQVRPSMPASVRRCSYPPACLRFG